MTPIITVNCSSLTTVNQGDYFACKCKGTDGNPPAAVTWYKDNTQIITGNEEAILRFPSVYQVDNGTYICEAKSLEEAKNETLIELIVTGMYTHINWKISHRSINRANFKILRLFRIDQIG